MNAHRLMGPMAALAVAGCTTGSAEDSRFGGVPLEAEAPAGQYQVVRLGMAEARTRTAIAQTEKLNPQIGAVLALDPTALDQARAIDARGLTGPLAGKPVLIKDNIEAAGPLATTAGSIALANNVTNRDAPIVARLRHAGAVILGKANLSEWANIRSNNSISGWSAVGGQTRNPYALDRNPCGSSSGSGSAVAAGIVRYAIGTETDGSITCPAAINGIVGLKPTVGLVSRTHIIPISESQDTAGPMAPTVREAAQLLTVIAGRDADDPATREADRRKTDYAAALDRNALNGKRIGVMRFASGFGTDAAFETALAVLKEQGATLVDIKEYDDGTMGRDEYKVLLTEFKAGLNRYLRSSPAQIPVRSLADLIAFNQKYAEAELALFGQETFIDAEKTKGLDDPAYKKARADSFRAAGPNGIDRLLKQHNVVALVGPTMPPAWKIDAVNGDQISGGGAGSLAAVSGYPHLTVPMGMVKGLPVGISFIGPKWSEALLLSLGADYEQARGGFPNPLFHRSIEESPAIAPELLPQIHQVQALSETRGSGGAALLAAEAIIDAFYAFDPARLRTAMASAPKSMPQILYYQGWAQGGNYAVLDRKPCRFAKPDEITCDVTVRDDLIQALGTGFDVTDTFHMRVETGRIAAIHTSSNDPPEMRQAFEWLFRERPDVRSGPCRGFFAGGPTPQDCVRAVVAGFAEFTARRRRG